MPRNLDLTALRSFVTVSDLGGVTRAAGALNLTQSAVSMQLKRLEESLGIDLLDRSNRTIALTATGEQLVGYARQMLALNDEVLARLTDSQFEGEITLGVPHDIVFPYIPSVLQTFSANYPRMKVQLMSSYTGRLKQQFVNGECDIILTTETELPEGARHLSDVPLVWVGAKGGSAWKQRPLRLAYEYNCSFRRPVQRALDRAGISWEMAVESHSTRSVEASVSADLAVHTMLAGSHPSYFEMIPHNGALPELGSQMINQYVRENHGSEPIGALADLVAAAYARP